jgi:predicted HicB family RNase H-like nuclease
MAAVVKLNQQIDTDLHHRMQLAALQQGKKQHVFVAEAIREKVERHEAEEEKRRRGR